jgi:hypothetical protein
MMRWCYGAELGLALADRELAAHSDAALAPYAGRSCSAAQIGADGPVDLYRALAAAALGETARATEIADEAARQCIAWDVPRAAERLAGYRRVHGFRAADTLRHGLSRLLRRRLPFDGPREGA